MNKNILNKDVQNFINDNLNVDPIKLILKGVSFPGVTIQEVAQQVDAKQRSKKKLPSWYECENIYFPRRLNIEQTSSEITAKYKSELISGKSLIDITGGFGVDCLYFSKKFNAITHCEVNMELSEIVRHNLRQMVVKNIETIPENGLNYLLETNKKFDWIYVDPSRRDDLEQRVYFLSDCNPNIIENIDLLFEHSDNILIKVSPFLDITATIKALPFTSDVVVVAVNNEVKEILFIVKKIKSAVITIKAVNIEKERLITFTANYGSNVIPSFDFAKKYLYEPNAAILKAGLFNEVSYRFNLSKLHMNSHLYTSSNLMEFPGRSFEIMEISSYNKKKLKRIIPLKKANITTRNFPQSVDQIRKKTGIKEGGDIYLFFTTDKDNKKIVLICKKIVLHN